jgi:hypothetical protein
VVPTWGAHGLHAPVQFPTGGYSGAAEGLAIDDVDGDGLLDVIISDGTLAGGYIAVFYGVDGGLSAPQFLIGPTDASSVVVADFNGDGRSDLATTSSYAPITQIDLGFGNRTFDAGSVLDAGGEDLASGDFNGDGEPDLAIAGGMGIGVFLNSMGDFGPSTILPGPTQAAGIAVVDLNGDGHLDLATTDFLTGIWTFLGTGTGAFQPGETVGEPGRGLAVADFNGDGRPDLATSIGLPSGVSVALNQGGGSFSAPIRTLLGQFALDLASGDFNADGVQDLIVADGSVSPTSLIVALGRGDGTFEPMQNPFSISSTGQMQVADLNHDGHPDVVVVDVGAGNVWVLFGY